MMISSISARVFRDVSSSRAAWILASKDSRWITGEEILVGGRIRL